MNAFIPSELESFVNTSFERQKIYTAKEMGLPKPWTKSPILQAGYFCNVFRDQDKTTEWFYDEIYVPNFNDPLLWSAVIACRYLSNIEAVQVLKEAGAFEGTMSERLAKMMLVFIERMAEGQIINTEAFKLPEPNFLNGTSRPFYLIKLLETINDSWPGGFERMQDAYNYLTGFYGVDSFMGFQYVLDMAMTPILSEAPDYYSWAAYGRGSTKGLARLLTGTPVILESYKAEFSKHASDILSYWLASYESRASSLVDSMMEEFKLDVDSRLTILVHMNRFTTLRAAEVEHWLCEYDKYKDDWNKRLYI